MSIQHIDQLKTPLGTIDIVLIKDGDNEFAARKGPRQQLPLLGYNLADTVAQARTAAQATSTNTTPFESIPSSSTAEILSLSPFPRSDPSC